MKSVQEVLSSSNCFDMFGLEVGVDVDESKLGKIFLKLSLAVHPDKNAGNLDATKAFQAVSAAKELLMNKQQREKHAEEVKKREAEEQEKRDILKNSEQSVSSKAYATWMYTTFDFAKEEARKEEAARKLKKEREIEWSRINKKRAEEGEIRRKELEKAEEKEKYFQDPLSNITVHRTPEHVANTKAQSENLKRKLENFARQTQTAVENTGEPAKKHKRKEKKDKKNKKESKIAALRRERLSREAKESIRQSDVLWK
eukprot:TRINITY_DN5582_c2_g1_i1.p1 TRINITY_DN5582_c2_g1~~TRINITY_DN5582_c2_g1_i1.p1  ORF type:complete len:273 (+),score=74.66 TRINITY_DN5582_c2_g1_i1:49-819(+)